MHEGTKTRYFVDLWDVSGAPQFELSRSIFYSNLDGAPVLSCSRFVSLPQD